ncbi:NmrA family NAD(P)-binding protein [Desertivirga arenae]|uniref:NmrA family NAD(P)-binding protein n=1 Tax=Desertivirga arenae TaxID=2810309 RepID=UPI001A962F9F|nr:NmrA family NAD(P)-binding protein [Pedobacter sp. SYSU D00823]
MEKMVLVAGATGNLGRRICREPLQREASVSAIVRKSSDPAKREALSKLGVRVLEIDLNSTEEIVQACEGMDVVVSALAGLADVIVDLQKRVLDGALKAGVPRFIPSDFCTDYNDLVPGENRNFDLRRTFKAYLDSTSIKASSVFNGAFADILKYNTPLLNLKERSIGYWGDKAGWKLDFTTMDNTAAFTAEVALDDDAPRDLQIAGFQISPNMLWAEVKEITGEEFSLRQISDMASFAELIKKQRADNPAGEHELYAKWQQSQYMYSMFSTQHHNLSNNRYQNLDWTPSLAFLQSFVK